MSSIRSTGSKAEARLEEILNKIFKGELVLPHPDGIPGKPDCSVPSLSLLAFADGCFWHGCPVHGRIPDDNHDYWETKIARNRARDRFVTRELRSLGFHVVRLWDHELKDGLSATRKIRRVKRKALLARAMEEPVRF